MFWQPYLLAVVFGLAVSAGIYAAFLWPRVEPDDGDQDGDGDGVRAGDRLGGGGGDPGGGDGVGDVDRATD